MQIAENSVLLVTMFIVDFALLFVFEMFCQSTLRVPKYIRETVLDSMKGER